MAISLEMMLTPVMDNPQPLGLDPFTHYTFANQDLLMNMAAYLVEENGLIKARNKEVKVRPLDKEKIRDTRSFWQVINLVLPMIALIVFGIVRAYIRNLKYTRF
jgi:ABC-2 type transport system permease protein